MSERRLTKERRQDRKSLYSFPGIPPDESGAPLAEEEVPEELAGSDHAAQVTRR